MKPFKKLFNTTWFFDVESVPCAGTGRRIYDIENMDESETIDSMYLENGLDPEDMKKMIKSFMQKIVSVAAIVRTVKNQETKLQMVCVGMSTATEKEILTRFLSGISKTDPQLVGFASNMFDIPILAQRALIHGIRSPQFFSRPDKPWEGIDYFNPHSDFTVDLMDCTGSYQHKPKLHEIAQACGIPGKVGVKSTDVKKLYLEEKFETIEGYNQTDVATTYLLWLRMAHVFGHINGNQYDYEKTLLRKLLEDLQTDENEFAFFLSEWDRLEQIKL